MSEIKEELNEVAKFLLHIKALIWCLCKAGERYNLSKIRDAFRQRKIPLDFMHSTVGQNLSFIMGFLRTPEDVETLIKALEISVQDIQIRGGKKPEIKHPSGVIICEVGHYIEALNDLPEGIPTGTYGVLCALSNSHTLTGLFYISGQGLKIAEFTPDKVRFIFGTTIFTPTGARR
ncbi:MAG: hypothetical protein N2246_10720 [Candidatus Sumerlaeia bacterium]|nr:hypothetical protein [Candidatus Sumerlaeia bacterium]